MTATYERMNPPGLATIRRGGHVTMAQVVAVENARRIVYLSGQVSRDAQGNVVGARDMRAQMTQVGECVAAGLRAAGATFENVVKTQTFVTDMAEYLKHADLRARYFCNPVAASTTIEVKGLVNPDLMIEVDVIAVL
ncbi:MAG TPA: RidA family protein [Xanthobacteraceae bacterium]|jgi:enamine deaminase RidA (YjgF/YER057c/UK114 family)